MNCINLFYFLSKNNIIYRYISFLYVSLIIYNAFVRNAIKKIKKVYRSAISIWYYHFFIVNKPCHYDKFQSLHLLGISHLRNIRIN
jgi:hypothetical protein